MRRQSERGNEPFKLVKSLSSQVTHLEQLSNETGASPIDQSTSETMETMLLDTVAALRRIRNAEQPVSKLPPELLGQIFSLVPGTIHLRDQTDGLRRDFGPHGIAPSSDLLPLLSVCRRWREVATSCPFLWSTIDNYTPHSLSISSRYRSPHGPLNAHIRDTFQPSHDEILCDLVPGMRRFYQVNATLLNVLQNEGHRIREFIMEIPETLLLALTAFSGVNMQTCHLRLLEHSAYDIEAVQPLFCGCTPKLKSLVLGVLLFIPTNDFPSLTHLILDGAVLDTDPDDQYTFTNFLRFLSRCPSLEVLHLSALDVAPLHGVHNGGLVDGPVQLPHLRKFSNEESLADRTERYRHPYFGPHFRRAILTHLQLSPDCIVRLATILPHELEQTLNRLPFDEPFPSLYLSAFDNGDPSKPYTSGPNGIEHECLSLMATDASRRRQRGVRIDFQMPGTRYTAWDVTTQSARARLGDGVRAAPLLSRVRELWVVPMATVLLGEPCSLLGRLPHLATLVLGLCALAQDAEERVRDHWEPLRALEVRDDCVVPCPRLRTLCVYVGAEEHVVQLYHVLLSRGEARYPVRRLVVGFYGQPTPSVLELAEGLWGLVEDFTLLDGPEGCPDDLLWEDRLPFVCRDRSERNVHWPAWM